MIVVTGATGVLGDSFINGLHEAGARIVLIGRNEEIGTQRMNHINEGGSEALFLQADVLSKQDLEAARDIQEILF